MIHNGVPSILDSLDQYALETAVRNKNKDSAVKQGPAQAKDVLKGALSHCSSRETGQGPRPCRGPIFRLGIQYFSFLFGHPALRLAEGPPPGFEEEINQQDK